MESQVIIQKKAKKKKMNKEQKGQIENKQKDDRLNATISKITFHENGLNTPIKKQILKFNFQKVWPICHLLETQFKHKETNSLKVKGQKKISHSNAK